MKLNDKIEEELMMIAEKYGKNWGSYVSNGLDFYLDEEKQLIRITHERDIDTARDIIQEVIEVLKRYNIKYDEHKKLDTKSKTVFEYGIKYYL